MVLRIDGALVGEEAEQYEGGAEGRAAAISLGAGRSIAELAADVLGWSRRLEVSLSNLDDDAWDLEVRTVTSGYHSIEQLPFRRWREVEIHLVDMQVGAEAADWPSTFVDAFCQACWSDLVNALISARSRRGYSAEDRRLYLTHGAKSAAVHRPGMPGMRLV